MTAEQPAVPGGTSHVILAGVSRLLPDPELPTE